MAATIFLTVDLGFGDAGKGSVVDYLARAHAAHTVVRYNGGAQAGHRVVAPDGREHVFAQVGAGAFAGAATFLSRFMLLEPLALLEEARHLAALGLADPLAALAIDERALLITPFARALNRLRELARGDARHGSCGVGVGETVDLALAFPDQAPRAGDMARPAALARRLELLRQRALDRLAALRPALPDTPAVAAEVALLTDPGLIDWLLEAYGELARRAALVGPDHLGRLLGRGGTIVFEGAQGVLLDEWRGFHPHTTWSTTTLANADLLLAEAGFAGHARRIGITRAYATRHGAGPLVSERPELTAALPDPRNMDHPWQRGFRVGWLDLVLLRYARAVVGPLDGLAVTCLDRLAALPELRVCVGYDHPGGPIERLPLAADPRDLAHQERLTATLGACRPRLAPLGDTGALLARLERELAAPVALSSWGPTAADKRACVSWI